jgi:hypothetical protein
MRALLLSSLILSPPVLANCGAPERVESAPAPGQVESSPSPDSAAEAPADTLRGTFLVIWEDPPGEGAGRVLYYLAGVREEWIGLEIDAGLLEPLGGAAEVDGRRVTLVGTPVQKAGRTEVRVRSIRLLPEEP